jgi:hypothetical protein
MDLISFLQVPSVAGTNSSPLIRREEVQMLPAVSKPDKRKTSEAGDISFSGNGGAKIVIPLLQSESSRSQDLQDITQCFQLLGQLNAEFLFSLTTGTVQPKCTFDICKVHVEKLPLFLDLMSITSEDPADCFKQTYAEVSSGGRKKQCVSVTANALKVPFEPPKPASASGLACVLMLLDGAASPTQLFGAAPCGPRLAIQCLSVRPTS